MRISRRDVAAGLAGAFLAPTAQAATPRDPARLSAAALEAASAPAGPHQVVYLWPEGAPGLPRVAPKEEVVERSQPPALRDRAIFHTLRPRLIVFRPQAANGAAMLLCPGGSYQRLAIDKEPYECAARFVREGITCFALLYRLPVDGWLSGPDAPLQDAQRAMRVIRARAREWNVDPGRVTAMGFSAGGHVAAMLAQRFDTALYPRVDAADDLSARPDLSGLIYPLVTMRPAITTPDLREALLGPRPSDDLMQRYSVETIVRADAPPTFLAAAADDDTLPIEGLSLLYDALRAKKVPVEMHIFETGGHGFGIRGTPGKPTAAWPALMLTFLRQHGQLR